MSGRKVEGMPELRCGFRQLMPLSQREFHCPNCGLVLDRDLNASFNILALGLQGVGSIPRSPLL